MESINQSIEINVEPKRARNAIVTVEGERRWWTTDCEVGTQIGERAFFRFTKDQMTRAMEFRIDRLDDDRIEWTCVGHQNNPEWVGTQLSFRLAPAGKSTRLDLAHTGWKNKSETYAACTDGWAYFMNSLKQYLETGKGTPHGNPGDGCQQ